jgi:hypothetical protein
VIVAVTAVVFVINLLFVHRELWDWLKLLIVPAVLAAGGLWFNRQQHERELDTAREQREREVEIAELRPWWRRVFGSWTSEKPNKANFTLWEGFLRSSLSSSTTTLGESKDEEQQRLTGVYEVPTMPEKEW